MLGEWIKENTVVKVYSSKPVIGSYEENDSILLCQGKISKIQEDTEIEFVVTDTEPKEMHKNVCYIMTFYSGQEMYLCNGYYESTYQQDSEKYFTMEITSPLEKVQRRMHQRVSCHGKMSFRILQPEQVRDMISEDTAVILPKEMDREEEKEDSMIDISGGGIRFTSKKLVEKNDYLQVEFGILAGKETIQMHIFGQVVSQKLFRNEKDIYDIRMKYVGLSEEQKEQIIQFVFQLERDSRRKE